MMGHGEKMVASDNDDRAATYGYGGRWYSNRGNGMTLAEAKLVRAICNTRQTSPQWRELAVDSGHLESGRGNERWRNDDPS